MRRPIRDRVHGRLNNDWHIQICGGGVEGSVVSELREEVHPGTEEYGDQSTRPDTTRSLMSTRVWAPEGSSRCRLRCHPGASRALEVAGVDRARRKAPRCCRRRGRGNPCRVGKLGSHDLGQFLSTAHPGRPDNPDGVQPPVGKHIPDRVGHLWRTRVLRLMMRGARHDSSYAEPTR